MYLSKTHWTVLMHLTVNYINKINASLKKISSHCRWLSKILASLSKDGNTSSHITLGKVSIPVSLMIKKFIHIPSSITSFGDIEEYSGKWPRKFHMKSNTFALIFKIRAKFKAHCWIIILTNGMKIFWFIWGYLK